MIGVGILALPYSISYPGYILGIIVMISVGILSVIGVTFLIEIANHENISEILYPELGERIYGKKLKYAI